MLQMIIANRLVDGAVVFFADGAAWVESIDAGAVLADDAEAETAMATAMFDIGGNDGVGFSARVGAGHAWVEAELGRGRWRRFDEKRAALMRAELERIVATPGLSKDVFEQASKSLG